MENNVTFNDPMFGFLEDRKHLTDLSNHLTNKFSGKNELIFFAAGELKEINLITVYKIKKVSLRAKYPILLNLSHSIQHPFDTLFDVYFYYNIDGKIAPIDIYNFHNNTYAQRRAESYYRQFEEHDAAEKSNEYYEDNDDPRSYRDRIWEEIKKYPNNSLNNFKTN
jgi:hypothetical protein